MSSLNLELDSLGSLFFVGLRGTEITPEERDTLANLRPIGFVPLAKNFNQDAPYHEWLEQFRALVEEFKAVTRHEKILLAIDHEGGRVVRPPAPITCFPYPIFWKDHTAALTQAICTELRSLGVNLSFSPVCDVHSNPANPVIGPRSFGSDPSIVSKQVEQSIKIYRENNILPCAKHFPGHGDTTVDSHLGLPELDLDQKELLSRELVPFKAAIAAGVPAVMSAHIVFSKNSQRYSSYSFKTDLSRFAEGYFEF